MLEPRRIDMLTAGPSIGRDKVVKEKSVAKSMRFEVNLPPPSDGSFAEISYTNLVKEKFPEENDGESGGEDALEKAKMASLARDLEMKYGGQTGKGRKKCFDAADGYDDNDSFIDDEEAYDENVPSYICTKHGGFYINMGKLETKFLSDDEGSSDFQTLAKIKRKNKRVAIESDEEVEEEVVKKKAKRGPKSPKARKSPAAKVLNMQGRKRALVTKPNLKGTKGAVDGRLKGSGKGNKSKGYDSTINDVLQQGSHVGSPLALSKSENKNEVVPTRADKPADEERVTGLSTTRPAPSLPEGLSESVFSYMNLLKRAASKDSSDGKKKFFTAEVNGWLIGLDHACRNLAPHKRSTLLGYLATFMPVNKFTLQKRIRSLLTQEHSDKIGEPLKQLERAVASTMKECLESYAIEQEAARKQFEASSQQTIAAADRVGSGPEDHSGYARNPTETSQSGFPEAGEKKRAPIVRKKFGWTMEIENLLCTVVRIKLDAFSFSKVKGQQEEDYVKDFLELKVRTLWPKGWMPIRLLYLKCRTEVLKYMASNSKMKLTTAVLDSSSMTLHTGNKAPSAVSVTGNISNGVSGGATSKPVSVTFGDAASFTALTATTARVGEDKLLPRDPFSNLRAAMGTTDEALVQVKPTNSQLGKPTSSSAVDPSQAAKAGQFKRPAPNSGSPVTKKVKISLPRVGSSSTKGPPVSFTTSKQQHPQTVSIGNSSNQAAANSATKSATQSSSGSIGLIYNRIPTTVSKVPRTAVAKDSRIPASANAASQNVVVLGKSNNASQISVKSTSVVKRPIPPSHTQLSTLTQTSRGIPTVSVQQLPTKVSKVYVSPVPTRSPATNNNSQLMAPGQTAKNTAVQNPVLVGSQSSTAHVAPAKPVSSTSQPEASAAKVVVVSTETPRYNAGLPSNISRTSSSLMAGRRSSSAVLASAANHVAQNIAKTSPNSSLLPNSSAAKGQQQQRPQNQKLVQQVKLTQPQKQQQPQSQPQPQFAKPSSTAFPLPPRLQSSNSGKVSPASMSSNQLSSLPKTPIQSVKLPAEAKTSYTTYSDAVSSGGSVKYRTTVPASGTGNKVPGGTGQSVLSYTSSPKVQAYTTSPQHRGSGAMTNIVRSSDGVTKYVRPVSTGCLAGPSVHTSKISTLGAPVKNSAIGRGSQSVQVSGVSTDAGGRTTTTQRPPGAAKQL